MFDDKDMFVFMHVRGSNDMLTNLRNRTTEAAMQPRDLAAASVRVVRGASSKVTKTCRDNALRGAI